MKELVNRFKEPSSWAGIAVVINVLSPVVGIPTGAGEIVVNAAAGLCAVAAFFIREKK